MKKYLEQLEENCRERGTFVALKSKARMKGLTYFQLWEYSGRVYAYLKNHGIGKESMLLICMPRGVRTIVAAIGVWRAGAAFAFDCSYNKSTSPAGNYDITPKGLTSDNYAITFKKGTLTVKTKPTTCKVTVHPYVESEDEKWENKVVNMDDNPVGETDESGSYTITDVPIGTEVVFSFDMGSLFGTKTYTTTDAPEQTVYVKREFRP